MITDTEVKELYAAIAELIQNQQANEADELIQTLLERDPNDGVALNFYGVLHLEAHHFGEAYQYFRRALQERPNLPTIWLNFGLAAHELNRNEESIKAYLKAAELDNNFVKAYVNAAAVFIEQSQWDDAEKSCRIALEIDPGNSMAEKNMAHVLLAKHNWKEGWGYWEKSLGSKFRKEWAYDKGEKRWDGTPGQAVVIYGEQGLGDEINYASCIPDAIRDCKKVIIDCDPRLEKLFKRSFPKANVHGTRREPHPEWLKDARIDARAAMASLPSIYRNTDESFPGTPYLTADPELRSMFRKLFDSYGKPVIGMCFKSGSRYTLQHKRSIEPEQFSPLFKKDAVFISLEYKEIINHPLVKDFSWATQAKDYDLTAAMIAEMDAVIGIHTTALHCANALGTKTYILTPDYYQWRYEGEYLWSKTAKVYHKQKDEAWREVVKRAVNDMELKDK